MRRGKGGGFKTVKGTKRDEMEEERGGGEREEQGNGMVDKAWHLERKRERKERIWGEKGKEILGLEKTSGER